MSYSLKSTTLNYTLIESLIAILEHVYPFLLSSFGIRAGPDNIELMLKLKL